MKPSTLPCLADRPTALNVQRSQKMARSAHAYVRGSTVKFYEWLEAQKQRSLPEGPPVWICGDCHAGNLGLLANAEGKVEIQIRDMDQRQQTGHASDAMLNVKIAGVPVPIPKKS